jgi:hypothetical protein
MYKRLERGDAENEMGTARNSHRRVQAIRRFAAHVWLKRDGTFVIAPANPELPLFFTSESRVAKAPS